VAFGHHTVIGMIASDQPPSLALHERFGFEKVAHLREVGEKFGQRLDVVFMQKML
jgi:phosphinothricin acetyltransferase